MEPCYDCGTSTDETWAFYKLRWIDNEVERVVCCTSCAESIHRQALHPMIEAIVSGKVEDL